MEQAVRDIVSRLDFEVATMKTVYQEYCKVIKVEELSSLEKSEVRCILGCIFEELNANQGVSINEGDSLPSTHSAHESTKKDFDRDSEVDEMKSSQIEEIIQQEYVSSIEDLLVDQKENENGDIIKESSLKSYTKKKRFRRMRLKDVMDFVLDSDDEKVYSSPVECPKKVESARDEFIYEDHVPKVPLRNAASKMTGKQVLDSILYSDTDDEFSSLNDRRSNDGDSDDMVERSDSGIVCRRTEANREHEAVLRKCSVVLKDCLLNSERHTNGEISMMVVNSVRKNLSSHNTPSRKRISSSSSDDSDGIESFSLSDDEVLAHCARKGDKSDNVKDENSDVDKNVNSSGDSDTSSHSNVLPLTGGEKVKQKTESKLNKIIIILLSLLLAIASLLLMSGADFPRTVFVLQLQGRPSMKAE